MDPETCADPQDHPGDPEEGAGGRDLAHLLGCRGALLERAITGEGHHAGGVGQKLGAEQRIGKLGDPLRGRSGARQLRERGALLAPATTAGAA